MLFKYTDRQGFFLLMLAICFAPFFLIFKYTIFYGTPFWVFHGLTVIALFLIFFSNKLIKGNLYVISNIDLWMHVLFFYYLWLCFFAILLGSEASNFYRVFWQYVIGLMVYFLTVNYLNFDRIKIIENIFCFLSFIVAVLFLSEWTIVHLLGMKSFPWSLAMHEHGLIKKYYVSYGGGSLSWYHLIRIGGTLGTYPMTSLFMGLGTIFLFFRAWIMGFNLRTLIMLIVCSLGLILSFSRFTVVGVLISILFTSLLLNRKYKWRLFYLVTTFFIIAMLSYIFANDDVRIMLKGFYFEKLFIDIFAGEIPFGSVSIHLKNIIAIMGEYIMSCSPLVLLTGSGFGYFQGETAGLAVSSGDFGWASHFNRVGGFGFFIIGMILFQLIKKTYIVSKNRYIDPYLKYIMISSLSFVLASIIATFHYGAMHHSGNYYCFFMAIGLIAYVDQWTRRNCTLKLKSNTKMQ